VKQGGHDYLALRTCAEGEVLRATAVGGWECAAVPEGSAALLVRLDALEQEVERLRGQAGQPGPQGPAGLACRDLDEDGVQDAEEDVNGDGDPEGQGTVLCPLPPGEAYDIPLRCLLPQGVEGLLVAGRCISATHEAHASYRIMPVCMAPGQAAGACAALAAALGSSPRSVPSLAVQTELLGQGAILRAQSVQIRGPKGNSWSVASPRVSLSAWPVARKKCGSSGVPPTICRLPGPVS